MTPAVAEAIEEVEAALDGATVTAREDGAGGAFVVIDRIDPGPPYAQRETWMGFQITFQYPYSDVYPLFVRPDLTRLDGGAHGQGFALGTFDGRPAMQLSRRSNHLNPAVDTAELKVVKVLEWLWTQ